MGVLYDPFAGLLFHEHPIRLVTSDPSSAKEGSLIINTTTDEMKIYYSGAWQVLHTLTPAAASYLLQEDGSSRFLLEDGVSLLLLE